MRGIYYIFPDTREGSTEVEILEQCPACREVKIRFPNGRVEWVMSHYIEVPSNGKFVPLIFPTEKILHFKERLPENIIKGEIDITWRCFDKKNLSLGDALSLRDSKGIQFARAEILWIRETTFSNLTEEDKKGHEKFASDADMYKTYSLYYRQPVTLDTHIKVVKFKLI